MLLQILLFLLDVAAGLVTAACLLRWYMQAQRVPFNNPVGRLVFAFSDWLVLPLRRVVRPAGRWDHSSLLAAALVQLAQYLLVWLLIGLLLGGRGTALPWFVVLALAGLLRVAITGLMGLVLVYVVLSWVQTRSVIHDVFTRLAEPLLRPVRRVLPLLGGIDLSPLVVLVALQVLLIVLSHLQAGWPG